MNGSASTSQKHRRSTTCYTSAKCPSSSVHQINKTNSQTPVGLSSEPGSPVPGPMANTRQNHVRPPPSLEKFRSSTFDPNRSNTLKRRPSSNIDKKLNQAISSGNSRDQARQHFKSRGHQNVSQALSAEHKRLRDGSTSMRQGRRAEPSRENTRDRDKAYELKIIREELSRRMKKESGTKPDIVDLTGDSSRLTVIKSPADDDSDVTDSEEEDGGIGCQENLIWEQSKYSSKPVDRRSVSRVSANDVHKDSNEPFVIQISEGESESENKNRLKRNPRKSKASDHENVRNKQGVQNKEAHRPKKKNWSAAVRTELRSLPIEQVGDDQCDKQCDDQCDDEVYPTGWNNVSNPLIKSQDNSNAVAERYVAGKDSETITLDDDDDDDDEGYVPSPKPRSADAVCSRKNVQQRSKLLGSLSTSLKNGNSVSPNKRIEQMQGVSGSRHNFKDKSAALSEHIRKDRKNNVDTRKRSDVSPVVLSQIVPNSVKPKRVLPTPTRNHCGRRHTLHSERIENVDAEIPEVESVEVRIGKTKDHELDIFDRTPKFSEPHPDPLNLGGPKRASPPRGKPTFINLADDDPVEEVIPSRKNLNIEQSIELVEKGAEPEAETSQANDKCPSDGMASPKSNTTLVVANVDLDDEVDSSLKATNSADVAPIEMSLNKVTISEPSDIRPKSPSFGFDSASSDENIDNNESNIRLTRLNNEELEEWASVTRNVKKAAVLAVVKEARISLCGRDFACLRACRWLNDEILNSFVALINARNREYFKEKDNEEIVEHRPAWVEDNGRQRDEHFTGCDLLFSSYRPRTHVFNTFFFERLKQNSYDYNGVRRWLQKAGKHIRDLDLILVPINIDGFHWVLAAIDLKHRIFVYMDSMNRKDTADVIPTLQRWLIDEVRSKIGDDVVKHLDIINWKYAVNPLFTPQQKDGGSCGVFTLYLADYLELGKKPDYSQKHIARLRQRAVLFLKNGKLPDE